MWKVLPLLFLLAGCASGPSMEVDNDAPPGQVSEPMPHPGLLGLFGSREEVKETLAAGGEGVRKLFGSREEVKEVLMAGGQEIHEFIPSSGFSIEVMKLDREENTYELAPRLGSLSFSASSDEVKQALTARAQEVCAPGSVALLDFDRPDYIGVDVTPRGYLRCR